MGNSNGHSPILEQAERNSKTMDQREWQETLHRHEAHSNRDREANVETSKPASSQPNKRVTKTIRCSRDADGTLVAQVIDWDQPPQGSPLQLDERTNEWFQASFKNCIKPWVEHLAEAVGKEIGKSDSELRDEINLATDKLQTILDGLHKENASLRAELASLRADVTILASLRAVDPHPRQPRKVVRPPKAKLRGRV